MMMHRRRSAIVSFTAATILLWSCCFCKEQLFVKAEILLDHVHDEDAVKDAEAPHREFANRDDGDDDTTQNHSTTNGLLDQEECIHTALPQTVTKEGTWNGNDKAGETAANEAPVPHEFTSRDDDGDHNNDTTTTLDRSITSGLPDHEARNITALTTIDVFEMLLSQDLQAIDPQLPSCVDALKARGAHRCWHKHSTFLEHLLGVHHILRLWEQGPVISRVGLFHSAYSNSYVNLALFQAHESRERQLVQSLVGDRAEDLIYLFCVINRQEIVVNTLLKQGYIPSKGMHVPHLRRPDEQLYLDAEILRMLVVFTMADISDQYFGWQDVLFGGDDHSMLIPGMDQAEAHDPTALWPGLSKPGLWMSYVSQLGAVAKTFHADDADTEAEAAPDAAACPANESATTDAPADVPPVFDNCSKVLQREDEVRARDLYWSVIMGQVEEEDDVIDTLQRCIDYNPWAFEPHVVLAQKLLHRHDYFVAQQATERALELQRHWGTAWDKRLSFAGWVAWTRVLHQRAQDRLPWPTNSWDVNNFGLVRG